LAGSSFSAQKGEARLTSQHNAPNEYSSLRERAIRNCSQCDGLLQAALDASKAYHDLLAALEAADIRHNPKLAHDLQAEETKSASTRDYAIMALRDHERTHAKGAQREFVQADK
jgi:hypothetical protein